MFLTLVRGAEGVAVRGRGEGVMGVGKASAINSHSLVRRSEGKNCEPEQVFLGRGWRVPMGQG